MIIPARSSTASTTGCLSIDLGRAKFLKFGCHIHSPSPSQQACFPPSRCL